MSRFAWFRHLPGVALTITHNEAGHQFETELPGGIAFLKYRIVEGSMFLLFVEVPPRSRGKGHAGELTQAALEYAATQNLKVVPVCPYTVAYVDRHPQYQALL